MSFPHRIFPALFFLFTFLSISLYSKNKSLIDTTLIKNNPKAEETFVQLRVDNFKGEDISSYLSGDTIYLPIGELFSFLKVRYEFKSGCSKISGTYIDKAYTIDLINNLIRIDENIFNLNRSDYYWTEIDVYLSNKTFKKVFGLNFEFTRREQEVYLRTDHQLPLFLLRQRELLRDRLSMNMMNEKKDIGYIVKRERKLLGGVVFDWSLNHFQSSSKYLDYSYSLSTGAEILGGDFDATLNGSKRTAINWKYTPWRWRYVSDDALFRQGMIGDVSTKSGQSLTLQGVQITNSPVRYRRIFGSYSISDQTIPNSEIEMYNNNQLINFQKVDSTGNYFFRVPIFYGSNYITLKQFSSFGEERSKEKLIQIPSSFLPENEFEYFFTIGKLKYYNLQKTSEMFFNYGLSSRITAGAGLQYIDDKTISQFTPFFQTSFLIGENLIVNSEYLYKNKIKGRISLLFPSQVGVEISYTKFAENRFFNIARYTEEKFLSLQLPFRINQSSFGLRFNLRESVYENRLKFLNSYNSIYLYFYGVSANITTYTSWINNNRIYEPQSTKSSLSTSFNLVYNILFQSQIDFDLKKKHLDIIRTNFYRNIFSSGWLDISVYRDFISKSSGFSLGFRWDLPFSQINSRIESSQNNFTLQQYARGAVGFDVIGKKIYTDNRNWVRRGAIITHPFLDTNGDGLYNEGEEELSITFNGEFSGGKVMGYSKETGFGGTDLEIYDTTLMKIDPTSINNPLLKLKHEKFAIITDPNQFKSIYIPFYTTTHYPQVRRKSVGGNKSLIIKDIAFYIEDE